MAARTLRTELATVGAPYLAPTAAAPQRGRCQRITRHLGDLFGFGLDPAVPATTNAAERALRHLVVARKISGGTRSAAGTAAKMALASRVGTWRAQELDPFTAGRALLATPQA